jgi:moderate conductance mechanosensitive channel
MLYDVSSTNMHTYTLFAASQVDSTVEQSKEVLGDIADTLFNARSLLSFVVAVGIAIILGRILAAILRRFAHALSKRADKSQDLKEVNRLRRVETLTILTVALIRMILVVLAVYFWWVYAHPDQQPTALIGASALVVIIAGATIGPILRDLAYGGVMMAEHWFGVGDHVKVEPFADLQGVVERVTLRSTKIRGLNGEIIWINNQNIQGVRVSPKGVRTIAIDIFVNDLNRGLRLLEQTNLRLPIGPLLVVRPLQIMSKTQVGHNLWHIVAVGETAPGREWMLQDYATNLMQEMDEEKKKKVLQTDPIARFSDSDAERRFARTIQNARKSPLQRRHLPLPEAIAKQLAPLGKKSPVRKPRKKIQ